MAIILQMMLYLVRSLISAEASRRLGVNAALAISCVMTTVSYLLVIVVYTKVGQVSVSSLLEKKPEHDNTRNPYNLVLLFVFALGMLVTTVNVIGSLTETVLSVVKITSANVSYGDPMTLALIFLKNVLLASFFEELLFRGAMLNAFEGKSRYRTVLLSALLFSVMHCNFHQIPYAFAAGILLASLVMITGSVLFGIALHFAQNLISFSFTLLDLLLKDNVYELVSNVAFFVFLAVAVVGVFWWAVSQKQHPSTQISKPAVKKKGGYPVLEITVYLVIGLVIATLSL